MTSITQSSHPSAPASQTNVGYLIAEMENKHYKMEKKMLPNEKKQLVDFVEEALTEKFGAMAGTGALAFNTLMNLWVSFKNSLPAHSSSSEMAELSHFATTQVNLFQDNSSLKADQQSLVNAKNSLENDINVIKDADQYISSHDHWYDYLNPATDAKLAYFEALRLIFALKAKVDAKHVESAGANLIAEKGKIVQESENFTQMKNQEASLFLSKTAEASSGVSNQLKEMENVIKTFQLSERSA